MAPRDHTEWPALPYDEWGATYATLHMWLQVVGKIALALAPPVNHSWASALRLTARGLTTDLLPHRGRGFTIEFDFIEHALVVKVSDGRIDTRLLREQSVAAFYSMMMQLLDDLGLGVRIWPIPVEIPDPIPFADDTAHHRYDPAAARRCWEVFARIAPLFAERRARFVGKTSPVHFFWGSFDLAVSRFSGRPAPPREGPRFMRDAYSHEVISHGFWPGSGPVREPAFYAYAVPEPATFRDAHVQPSGAYYHPDMGEFILPYDAVRADADPAEAIRLFIDSTYVAAATLGHWDRDALERSSSL